jgi:hypothetical protein
MKVVIDPYGDGLRLSAAAYHWLEERIASKQDDSEEGGSLLDFCIYDEERDEAVIQRHRLSLRVDPDLICALETLGESAVPKDCGVRVVDAPDDGQWEIFDVAGFEFIQDRHH